MRLFKRGGVYYVEFYDDQDRRQRRSTGRGDRAAAMAEARRLVAAILSGCTDAAAGETVTLRQAFNRCFLSVWADVKRSRNLVLLTRQIEDVEVRGVPLGAHALADITYDVLTELKAALEERGVAPGTIRNYFVPIKVAMKEALHWQDQGRPVLVQVPKFPKVVIKNTKDRIITEGEEEKLLAAAAARNDDRAWLFVRYIQVLLDTGMRRNEALGVRWKDVNRDTITLRRYTTKNDKPRQVPMTKRVRRALLEIRNTQRTDLEGPFSFLGADWVTKEFRRVADSCGLKDVSLHTCRHTCATRLLQRGMDIYMVSKWLGHSSVVITEQRYAHVTSDDLSIGAKLLEPGVVNVAYDEKWRNGT